MSTKQAILDAIHKFAADDSIDAQVRYDTLDEIALILEQEADVLADDHDLDDGFQVVDEDFDDEDLDDEDFDDEDFDDEDLDDEDFDDEFDDEYDDVDEDDIWD